MTCKWGALGFRFDAGGKSFAYVTDTSPFDTIRYPEKFVTGAPKELSDEDRRWLGECRTNLVKGLANADVVVYDTQYTDAEYEKFPHWGHGTPKHALDVMGEAKAKKLVLFHHAPGRTDDDQDKLTAETKEIAAKQGIEVVSAMEGMRVELG